MVVVVARDFNTCKNQPFLVICLEVHHHQYGVRRLILVGYYGRQKDDHYFSCLWFVLLSCPPHVNCRTFPTKRVIQSTFRVRGRQYVVFPITDQVPQVEIQTKNGFQVHSPRYLLSAEMILRRKEMNERLLSPPHHFYPYRHRGQVRRQGTTCKTGL